MNSVIESIIVRLLDDVDADASSSQEAQSILNSKDVTDDEVFLLASGLLVRRIVHGNKLALVRNLAGEVLSGSSSSSSVACSCLLKYIEGKIEHDDLLQLQRILNYGPQLTKTELRLASIAYALALLSLQLPLVLISYLKRVEVDSICSVIRLLSCEAYFQIAEYNYLFEKLSTLQQGIGSDWQARIAELALIRSGDLNGAVEMISHRHKQGLPLSDDVLLEFCVVSYRHEYFDPKVDPIVEESPVVSLQARLRYKAVGAFARGEYYESLNLLREVLPKVDDYLVQTMYFEISAKVNGLVVIEREIADYKELYGEDVFWFAVVSAIQSAHGELMNPFNDDPSLPYDQTEFFTYYSIISLALK